LYEELIEARNGEVENQAFPGAAPRRHHEKNTGFYAVENEQKAR